MLYVTNCPVTNRLYSFQYRISGNFHAAHMVPSIVYYLGDMRYLHFLMTGLAVFFAFLNLEYLSRNS